MSSTSLRGLRQMSRAFLYQKLLHIAFLFMPVVQFGKHLYTFPRRDKMEWNKSTCCKVPLKKADKDEWETWKVIVSQGVAEDAGIAAAASDLSGLSGLEVIFQSKGRTKKSAEHWMSSLPCSNRSSTEQTVPKGSDNDTSSCG